MQARAAGTGFESLPDFAGRVSPAALNKRAIEALADSGALDELGDRAVISAGYAQIARFAKQVAASRAETGQASLFDASTSPQAELTLPDVPPVDVSTRLQREKDILGMYLSGHPLAGLQHYLDRTVGKLTAVNQRAIGTHKRVYGIVSRIRVVTTKKTGQNMAFFAIDNADGELEISLFPRVYATIQTPISQGQLLIVSGRVEQRAGTLQIVANEIRQVSIERVRERAHADD